MRCFLVFAALILLSACAPAPAPRPVPAPAPLDPDAACLQDLRQMNVAFQPVEPFGDPDQGCGVVNPVKMSAGAVPWNRPGIVSCEMARTLARFESEVMAPLAQAKFGQGLKKIHHAGTYDCRNRRNASQSSGLTGSRGGRLSEHAKGLAIDLMAFELADGTMVSVKKDWRGNGAKTSFLRDLAKSSCRSFSVVLTPNHDRLHQDHFHLDLGPHTLCGY